MNTMPEGKPFRFIPKTAIGKGLLGLYILSFVSIAFSVSGIVFNDARMLGPMPEVALWTYFWYGMINVVLIGTYFYLFKPWSEAATEYVDVELKSEINPQTGESGSGSSPEPTADMEGGD